MIAVTDVGHARRQLAFPFLFVLLWSTGFIALKYGLPYAPPLTFLLYRFALVAALMTVVALATQAGWPATLGEAGHVAVAGWLVHGAYLGGVFVAVARGMPTGTAALLVGLQPILTVFLARGWLGERVVPRQWLGLALGLGGLVLVVSRKFGSTNEVTAVTLAAITVALLSITAGTLYQKRYVAPADVRGANAIQLAAALVVTLPLDQQVQKR